MSDSTIYQQLWDLVQAVEGAESYWFGVPEDAAAEGYPAVLLKPMGWIELDQVDPVDPERVCQFEVRVIQPGQGGFETFARAEAIAWALLAAIRGSDLGGLALPADTRLETGQVEYDARTGRSTQVLAGEFRYLPREDG